MTKIAIIGGVAGGASAAARARRLSEDAEIIMFERGKYISFANCGLPYHLGGKIRDRNDLILQTPESFLARFNIDVRTQQEVLSIEKENKCIRVKSLLDGTEYIESYDYLLLSPGAAPIMPPIVGVDNPLVHTLRNIPDMDKILNTLKTHRPSHATVIGGGFIGLEVMEAFHRLDIQTTLVELADQVMTPIDREMAGFVHGEIKKKNIDLRLGLALESVEYVKKHEEAGSQSEKEYLNLSLSNGDTLQTEILVMAIGVRPESALARDAGLKMGELGGIWVDDNMKTSDPYIYAVGDASEDRDFVTGNGIFVPLAGPANRQGRIAADNMFGREQSYQHTQGTAICKIFDLAIASTGRNEKSLKREGIAYKKVYVHGANHASYYPGAEIISFKLLYCPKTLKILGAQAVGKEGIDKRIDVMSVAQRAGITIDQLEHLELTYAPPFGSAKDVINQAAFVANNIEKGDVKAIHFEELESLSSEQILLDVRSRAEVEKYGSLPGALNIPVDELRSRLCELPKDKEIITLCAVGLRGHVAYRLLVNKGYSARNLIGGFRTYSFSKC